MHKKYKKKKEKERENKDSLMHRMHNCKTVDSVIMREKNDVS
jgi:hypothetical protein